METIIERIDTTIATTLPQLTGSKKQVGWASRMREDRLKSLAAFKDEQVARFTASKDERMLNLLLEFVQKEVRCAAYDRAEMIINAKRAWAMDMLRTFEHFVRIADEDPFEGLC